MKIYEQYLVAYCSMPEGIEAMTIRPDIPQSTVDKYFDAEESRLTATTVA
jgi:hypothetical protein